MATEQRRCLSCNAVIAATARGDRRFCSTACRMRAHRRRHGLRSVSRDQLELLIAGVEPPLAESALVEGIARAARDDWKAAAYILSRRWPERWGRPDGMREPDGKPL